VSKELGVVADDDAITVDADDGIPRDCVATAQRPDPEVLEPAGTADDERLDTSGGRTKVVATP
jgi:hypothetical protein